MSADATAYVWRFSPRQANGAFLVHLAIADSVNDQHGYRCWMTQDTLAAKTRTSIRTVRDALAALEADGFLERVGGGQERGSALQFRFVFKRHLAAVYNPQELVDKRPAKTAGVPAKVAGGSAKTAGVIPKGLSPKPVTFSDSLKVLRTAPATPPLVGRCDSCDRLDVDCECA